MPRVLIPERLIRCSPSGEQCDMGECGGSFDSRAELEHYCNYDFRASYVGCCIKGGCSTEDCEEQSWHYVLGCMTCNTVTGLEESELFLRDLLAAVAMSRQLLGDLMSAGRHWYSPVALPPVSGGPCPAGTRPVQYPGGGIQCEPIDSGPTIPTPTSGF